VDRQTHSRLVHAHATWDAANRHVRECERKLAAALSDYEAGKAPLPIELLHEVEALRADCGVKFKALLAAMHTETA